MEYVTSHLDQRSGSANIGRFLSSLVFISILMSSLPLLPLKEEKKETMIYLKKVSVIIKDSRIQGQHFHKETKVDFTLKMFLVSLSFYI